MKYIVTNPHSVAFDFAAGDATVRLEPGKPFEGELSDVTAQGMRDAGMTVEVEAKKIKAVAPSSSPAPVMQPDPKKNDPKTHAP